MQLRLTKTSRRKGFKTTPIPMGAPKVKKITQPKLPKVKPYGSFPKGHVY